jgi:CDP-diacylglycerol--glycerol-3-phosphate 3-phosphatidyltransferase
VTYLRVAVVPAMIALLWDTPTWIEAWVAMWVFVLAMIGDVVDGYLARKWDLQSATGAFLDPLADKLLVLATLVMMIPLGWISAWVVIVLESRELIVGGLRQVAASEGMVIPAGSLGKFKTSYQSTAIGFLLVHYPHWGLVDPSKVGVALLYVSMLLSIASMVEYAWGFARHARARAAAGGLKTAE